MNIPEKQRIIASEFNNLDNWDDRFSYIMQKGMAVQAYPSHLKTDEYLIRSCQSRLWLCCTFEDNKIHFFAHSDTVIVRGILGILSEIYSGASPEEIINTPLTIFEKAGIQQLFSNRATGITGILTRIRDYALLHV